MIKAATERVWDAATALSLIVVPDELPVDEEG